MRSFLYIVLFVLGYTSCIAQEIHKRAVFLMGSDFELTVVAPDVGKADKYISMAIEEIERIENLISSWNPNSQTSLINTNAGIKAVTVDIELYELVERALKISKLTDGAFDISYAAMDNLWKFNGTMDSIPTKEAIAAAIAKVGYRNIEPNSTEQSVFLKYSGMKIAFGALGKGYAADKAKALLMTQGVTAGIINASGDINTWGMQPNSMPWKVAITNPLDKNKAFALLPVQNSAVVTLSLIHI